jgi:hypothetical protein
VLREKGMEIDDLEGDPRLQDLVLSLYHVTTLLFSFNPGVMKIIENHAGRAVVRAVSPPQLPSVTIPRPPPPPAPP